ncbi:MAG TPA: hypothetical protein VFH94_06810 [Streptomyces sp.]|nr:hypothetical protein [Streptomyces sp.]
MGPIDLPTLLKDHVLPALVARGVVARDETPALTEGPNPDAPDAPAPGTVTVRPVGVRLPPAEPVRSPPVGRARSAPGERARRAASSPSVHVHIGQVVVTRPPAVPPPPAPSPPGPSASTDHAAYLARREEGR